MNNILIVEDETQMRAGLKDNLEFEGYTIDVAEDGQIGLEKGLQNPYDLIILDVMLPKLSGFDVCKKIRESGITIPIIMLTAKGEEIDKVLGLELGADDYVTKPFSLRELLARVKAILRRVDETKPGNHQKIVIGKLEIDFDAYTAIAEGKSIDMTHKEFEVIKYLWWHRGATVSRDKLLEEVWGYEEYPTTRTVDNFILKLRQKIEINPNKPQHILTVHGIGYKLIT
jgi:DNA-binding response OmpR family regulator